MQTPCKNICQIDEETGLCLGCGRTRLEIARWSSITDAERARIMADLSRRQQNRDGKDP